MTAHEAIGLDMSASEERPQLPIPAPSQSPSSRTNWRPCPSSRTNSGLRLLPISMLSAPASEVAVLDEQLKASVAAEREASARSNQ